MFSLYSNQSLFSWSVEYDISVMKGSTPSVDCDLFIANKTESFVSWGIFLSCDISSERILSLLNSSSGFSLFTFGVIGTYGAIVKSESWGRYCAKLSPLTLVWIRFSSKKLVKFEGLRPRFEIESLRPPDFLLVLFDCESLDPEEFESDPDRDLFDI